MVDYAICNAEFFSLVQDFNVLPFCKLYSDIHSPLVLMLHKQNNLSELDDTDTCIAIESNVRIGKWKHEQLNDYRENIDKELITE